MRDPMVPFFGGRQDYETASLPTSWRWQPLEVQRENLGEVYPGMTFEPIHERALPEVALGWMYVPKLPSLVEFLNLPKHEFGEISRRVLLQAELYAHRMDIEKDLLEGSFELNRTLFRASVDMETNFRYDWNILPVNPGGIHGGYAPVQVVTRALRNKQFPFALYHMAILIIAIRPQITSAQSHFVQCCAEIVSVQGEQCVPQFRLHHSIQLGWGRYTEVYPNTGAPVFLFG